MNPSYDLPKKIKLKALKGADDELFNKHLQGEFDEGDPNHPKYNDNYNYATGKFTLFGSEQNEFMSKQYATIGELS